MGEEQLRPDPRHVHDGDGRQSRRAHHECRAAELRAERCDGRARGARQRCRGGRLTGRAGIARAIYVTAIGRRVVIVRVFVKKTQRTPRHELKIARQRAEEVT
ncbi:MAG: hypothetical protein HC871_11200 [Rhizobiales bacterium]|nr:hypothetical protein [Hyphomicrobiales bacterium]